MTQNAKIVELLRNLGFCAHDLDGDGTDFFFKFRQVNYLLMNNNDDENFIRIAIPQVFSVSKENKAMAYHVIERLGYVLKYVKAGISEDDVWLYYEHYVDDDAEPSEELIEHIIRSLHAGYTWFKDALDNYSGEDEEGDDDDDLDFDVDDDLGIDDDTDDDDSSDADEG